jgi:Phage portal protein
VDEPLDLMPDFANISKRLKTNSEGRGQPPGRFSFGTQLLGGPSRTDAFGNRRAPSPTQLIENYGAIIYAMVDRNRNGVSRLPMRLLADGSRVQGKPKRACDAIKVSRAVGEKLAKSGQISTAAIDQVYELRNHPILDVLKKPDPYKTFTKEQFIGIIVAFMDVVGSCYIVPEGNGWDWRKEAKSGRKGPPEALWVVYPQYTIPIRMAASPIVQWFQYFNDRLPLDSVLWFRHTHSLRDCYGASFSPTYAAESYRNQEQEQVAILSQALGLGPRPSLLLTAKDPMAAAGRDEQGAYGIDVSRKLSGAGAGGLLVLDGSYDATPLSFPPADLANKEVAEHDIYLMASIMGQPPTYYTVDSNLANLQAADAHHDKFGVQPRCKTVAGIFTEFAQEYDPRLMLQFDAGLPDDELTKAQADKIYFDAGAVTINEWAEEKRYSKKPWGDAPWLPGTLKQPDMIMEAHEQSLEQADQEMMSGGIEDDIAVDSHEHGKKMDKASLQKEEARTLADAQAVLRTIKAELAKLAS